MPFKNTQRRAAYIWLSIGAAGILMTLVPILFPNDMFEWGGVFIFLGIFAALSGILVSLLFFKRARIIDNAFTGNNYLIHWKYDRDTWDKYTEKEYEYRKSVNKGLLLVIGGMCFIMGIIFWIIDPDAGKHVFLVMLGVIVILAITAVLTAVLTAVVPYHRNKKNVGEVFIFNDGLYINGQTHIWKGFTARLEKVSIDKKHSLLKFVYSTVTRAGRQNYTVLVPIPPGEMAAAENIACYFK